jgi:hypothetical protein
MNILLTLTVGQLKRAADIKEEITSLERELAAILHVPAPAAKTAAAEPVKKNGKMSAAGRTRIAAAQKARWAKIKAAKKG